jgi:hypothetical protein
MTTVNRARGASVGALALLFPLLASCSGSMPSSNGAVQAEVQHSKAQQYLYVGNGGQSGSKFVVYNLNGTKPLREFTRAWGVYGMAIDPWGDIYTVDAMLSGGEITAYTPGGRSVLLTISEDADNAVAIDSTGNVYDAEPQGIVVFHSRSKKILRAIGRGASDATALAFDSKGNLYAARVYRHGVVEVYAPGSNKPFRRITKGVYLPQALAFDASGNLYVANCPGCYHRNNEPNGSVAEYAPGADTPMRTIKKDLNLPLALATGSNGLLFIENETIADPGSILVYGPSGVKPLRSIDVTAAGLTVGPNGDLYIGQVGKPCCSVRVYDPTGSTMLRKITDGVTDPEEIATGSN